MAQLIMDHPASGCFGINLAPLDPITSRSTHADRGFSGGTAMSEPRRNQLMHYQLGERFGALVYCNRRKHSDAK
jgi:hypothetical protein